MQFVNWGQIKFRIRIYDKYLGKERNMETYIHSWMDGQRIMKASANWIFAHNEGQWSNLLSSMCSHSSRSMLVANIRWPSLIFIVSFSYLREWRAPPPRLIMGSSNVGSSIAHLGPFNICHQLRAILGIAALSDSSKTSPIVLSEAN